MHFQFCKEYRRAVIPVLAVVLMLGCCLSPLVADDSAAGGNQTYGITMSVGDTFTYTPTVNLAGATITAYGSAMVPSGGFLTFTGGVLSGTAAAAGSYSAVLTASYTGDGLTQTATQTINFTVYSAIEITGTKSITGFIGDALSASYTITGPADLTVTSDAATVNSSLTGAWAGSTYTLASDALTGTSGTAQTITVTVHSAAADRTETYQITLTPYNDLAITSGSTVYTYVGHTVTYDITTNYDGDSAAALTCTMSAPLIISDLGTASISGSTVTLAFLAAAVTGTGNYTNYSMTVTAAGTVSGTTLDTATKDVTVRVYKAIAFTTAPTTASAVIKASASNAAQMSLSMSIAGAQTVTYSWGDGIQSVIPSTTAASATYTAAHSYASSGVYQIRVTAANDSGSAVSVILYNAGDGTMTVSADGGSDSTGILGSIAGFWADYSLLIVLGVIAAVCAGIAAYTKHLAAAVLAAILIIALVGCWYLGWHTLALGSVL